MNKEDNKEIYNKINQVQNAGKVPKISKRESANNMNEQLENRKENDKKLINEKNKDYVKLFIVSLIILFLILIIAKKIFQKTPEQEVVYSEVEQSMHEDTLKRIAGKGEHRRVKEYFKNFLTNIENKNYSIEYSKLYDKYRANFFETQEDFVNYVEDFIPKSNAVNYKNFEILGDLYVLTVDILDLSNKENSLLNMRFVYKEEDLDRYVYSFSVHTPEDNGKDFAVPEEMETQIKFDTPVENINDNKAFNIFEQESVIRDLEDDEEINIENNNDN